MPDYTFQPYDILQVEADGKWWDYSTLRTEAEGRQAVALVDGPNSTFRIVRLGRKVTVYPVAPVCGDCGRETASDEGICYECQCEHHGSDFDMDGAGWL